MTDLNIVVGAGLTGATIARRLADRGKSVIVLEAKADPGGMCSDVVAGDEYLQRHGPHIFHTHRLDVWNFLGRFRRMIPTTFSSLAHTDIGLLPIPVTLHTFSMILGYYTESHQGLLTPRDYDQLSYILKTGADPEDDSFEGVCRRRVGDYIYNLAFKHYTEAWWGRPCSTIPGKIALRIPVRLNYDTRYHDAQDVYVGIPSGGFSVLIKSMLEGIPVHYKIPSTLKSVRSMFPDCRIFCTADASSFLQIPCQLPYRGFIVTHERADENLGFQQVMDTRQGSEGLRYYCSSNLLSGGSLPSPVVSRMQPIVGALSGDSPDAAYPLPWIGGVQEIEHRKEEMEQDRVFFAGRLGSYRYLDMDDAVVNGLEIVDKAFCYDARIQL